MLNFLIAIGIFFFEKINLEKIKLLKEIINLYSK